MKRLTTGDIRMRSIPEHYVPAHNEILAESAKEGYTELERGKTLEYADKNGLDILVPDEDELQIDIDTEEQYQQFLKAVENLNYMIMCPFNIVHNEPSKSGLPRRHIVIKMAEPLDASLRIALQACLGSDLRREMNNIRRVINNDIYPIVLYERKES